MPASSFEDWIDDDGIEVGRRIPLRVTLRKRGEAPGRGLDRLRPRRPSATVSSTLKVNEGTGVA